MTTTIFIDRVEQQLKGGKKVQLEMTCSTNKGTSLLRVKLG